jgi:hypothetical protein
MTTEAIFESSKTEKINQFLMLIKDPDIQPVLRMCFENILKNPDIQPVLRRCFENILATSELNILKRLQTLLLIGSNVFKNFNTNIIYGFNLILYIYGAEKQKLSFTQTFPKIEIQMFSNFK